MKLIVCLDDKNGMLFNKRRQSSDQILCRKILTLSEDGVLWMHPYSRPLFDDSCGQIRTDDHFMEKARPGEYCFAENIDVSPYLPCAGEIIIFRWNRVYPADLRFPGIPAGFQMVKSEEFPGFSHDRITMEVYAR